MPTLKVFHVINGLWPGGAQIMLLRLCEEFGRHGVQNEVFSLTKADTIVPQLEAIGVRCHQGNFFDLRRKLIESSPNVIQGWMYHGNLLASVVRRITQTSCPIFWSVHQSLASIKAEKKALAVVIRATARLSKSITKVVFSAESGLQQHVRFGYAANNAIAIRDNFDLDSFKPSGNGKVLNGELGLSHDALLVGSVARFAPMKDHANLVRAAAIVEQRVPKAQFIMIGPGTLAW